ncbi:orotate phosphoribosyltransferase [bacterium]|nr:orotate phosphoribosyltransferase [bacterium]
MNEKEILSLLSRTGALLEGHFLLSSGLHSDRYVQCAKLLQYPDIAEMVGRALSQKFRSQNFPAPDIVASPAIGGIVIGQEVARAMAIPHIFVEKDDTGKPVLRRGFEIEKGKKFIVVEDVITTGKSTNEVIELLRKGGGIAVGVLCIVDRSGTRELPFKDIPTISLIKLNVSTYNPAECPLCKENIPVVKPGSRKII